ncbi:Hint domain-containing protein [Rhodopila sp.]|jgi:hypothetical protein|uniref:Hint domain-containing protein n=1 Tax=Rhodopila sp. TaxID=2480087 RepID=UPI002C1D8861|nr:Hint domain-containing protein [Rhodopila sp.]HVZ09986.1 Hint domain-containing protein [Rhodopila sp.]
MPILNWNAGTSGVWDNAVWDNAGNRSSAQVPAADDLVLFIPPGSLAVEIANSVTAGGLLLAGGDIVVDATADLTISNTVSVVAGTVTNAGVLTVGAVENAGIIENTGLLAVTDGSVFNTGSIDDAGQVNFTGSVKTAVLHQIGGSGAILVIGTLDNTGQLAGTGGPALSVLGTIQGGTIDNSLGLSPDVALDGVTLSGRVSACQPVTILDGLTSVDGIGVLDTPMGGSLRFGNDQTIDGVSLVVDGTATVAGTLTLGQSAVWAVPTGSPLVQGLAINGTGLLVNAGTILTLSSTARFGDGDNALTISTAFRNRGLLSAFDTSPAPSVTPPAGERAGLSVMRIQGLSFVNEAAGTVDTGQGAGSGVIVFAAATSLVNDGLLSVMDPGARMGGTIDIGSDLLGSGTIAIAGDGQVTLEAGGAAGQTITFLGPGTLTLDAPRSVASGIQGFGAGDTITLAGSGIIPIDCDNGVLLMGSGDGAFALALAGTYTLDDLLFSNLGTATTIALAKAPVAAPTAAPVACFAAGTRIEVEGGARPVEELAIGTLVRTASGALRPVRWIGYRTVACDRHPRPERVWPIRVAAHAFGPGCPRRAVKLSPDHAVFAEGTLIPVRLLVNGTTVAQRKTRRITYFHVELDRHDILLAEGLPAESYLDTGDRQAFANGGTLLRLFPEFGQGGGTDIDLVREARACAPLLVTGPILAAIRASLDRQAVRLAHDRSRPAVRKRPSRL